MALDTETNGYGGDLCEMTEVGGRARGRRASCMRRTTRSSGSSVRSRAASSASPALHRAWWTERRRPRRCCPEVADLLEGRVLVAHNARFDVGVLRQAFERAGLDWPKPPVLCTVQLARRFAPLVRSAGWRRSPARSGSRWTRCTARCRTPSRARACSARCSRSCARTRSTIGDAIDLLRSRRRARKTEPGEAIPRDQRPDLSTLPDDPGVYVFRDERGRPLYVGKSVSLASRARAHFCAPAGLDRARGDRGLPADELGAGGARPREPAHQAVEAGRQQGAQAHRPLLLPALPAGHPVPGARGGGRAGGRARREHRPARQPGAGRPSSRTSSPRCTGCGIAAGR